MEDSDRITHDVDACFEGREQGGIAARSYRRQCRRWQEYVDRTSAVRHKASIYEDQLAAVAP